jgi:hypothetical protein
MKLTYENQVVVGTVLGGSSLIKPPKGANYYLSMRDQNELWLKYKMEEMPHLFGKSKIHIYGKTLRVNSCCSPILTEMKDLLYDGTKRIILMETLDKLMDIGLSTWFLDGGNKTGRNCKNAYINTTKYGQEGTEIVLQYFNEVGMPCNINRDGYRLKVLFTVKGTEVLFKTIAHKFPKFMYFRL